MTPGPQISSVKCTTVSIYAWRESMEIRLHIVVKI